MEKLVTLVNTNQTKPAIAPLAFDYLHEPLLRAGFRVELLDLCFSEDYAVAIAAYCRRASTARRRWRPTSPFPRRSVSAALDRGQFWRL